MEITYDMKLAFDEFAKQLVKKKSFAIAYFSIVGAVLEDDRMDDGFKIDYLKLWYDAFFKAMDEKTKKYVMDLGGLARSALEKENRKG